ncbi:MAG: hypothetical protein OXC38_05240 [Gammaproteobacteria bacterium]|nr:hypothetical protein [Gammaproteobacteria bacterium]
MEIIPIQIISTVVILVYIWVIKTDIRDWREEIAESRADFQRDRDIFRQERIRRDIADLRERMVRVEGFVGRPPEPQS